MWVHFSLQDIDKDNPKILIKSIQGDNSINNILKRKLKRYELNESEKIFNLEATTPSQNNFIKR